VSTAPALAGLAAALAAIGAGLLATSGRKGGGREADREGESEGGGREAGESRRTSSERGPRALHVLVRAGIAPRPGTAPRELDARISAAGRPAGLGAREVMAAKVTTAVLAGGLAAALGAAAPGRLAFALVIGGPAAGFLAPDLWLARRSAVRARQIRRELPPLLDLLRVSVESGSSLAQALAQVGGRTHGPLAAEWRAVGRQTALGVPLETALDAMVVAAPLPEVRALRAALDRARRHGAPLAVTLEAQARDARFALARHAREEAARAGPKIQLVVALLLVPSVLLLVAAASLAALLGGEGAAGALSS
jgi:tight adherence protein C